MPRRFYWHDDFHTPKNDAYGCTSCLGCGFGGTIITIIALFFIIALFA